MAYLKTIQNYGEIIPTERHIMAPRDTLSEVLIFSDGSLVFSGYCLYLLTAEKKGKETMHLIKSGGKTHNESVRVAEHTSKTLAINALYGILSVLHHLFGESNINFNVIVFCREVVESTLKVSSNTRVQKEQLI